MNFNYWIIETSLLIFPLLGISIEKFASPSKIIPFIRFSVIFLFLHNLFYFNCYSIIGDYFDRSVFSFEYFIMCIITYSRNSFKAKSYIKILIGALGILIQCIGLLVGFVGIIFSLVVSQDMEVKNVIHFTQSNKKYEVREYVAGFVTSTNTTYTFDTYQTYRFLPIEKQIDETNFFDTDTNLNLNGNIKFEFKYDLNKAYLIFSDEKGEKYTKELK